MTFSLNERVLLFLFDWKSLLMYTAIHTLPDYPYYTLMYTFLYTHWAGSFKVSVKYLSWPLSSLTERGRFPVLLTININSNFISAISPFQPSDKVCHYCSSHPAQEEILPFLHLLTLPRPMNNLSFLLDSGCSPFQTFLFKLNPPLWA